MADWFRRIKAALTPQVLLLLLLAFSMIGYCALREEAGGAGLLKGETGGDVPCGAMAVAQGADDPLVRMQLEQALCALLGLPNSAVSVVTGGK